MVAFLGRWYARRIVNVNVNVVLAGFLAGALTVIPVHLTHYVGVNAAWAIAFVAVGSDIVLDVAIYYALHWLANHTPNRHRAPPPPGVARLGFLRDATLVQFERAMLAPAYYLLFFWTIQIMVQRGIAREWATIVGVAVGLASTRLLHTLWMLRSARLNAQRAAALAAAAPIPPPAEAAAPTPVMPPIAPQRHTGSPR